jgi:hypothetical protein
MIIEGTRFCEEGVSAHENHHEIALLTLEEKIPIVLNFDGLRSLPLHVLKYCKGLLFAFCTIAFGSRFIPAPAGNVPHNIFRYGL